MKHHNSLLKILITSLFLYLAIVEISGSSLWAGELRIVASKNVPTESIDANMIKDIFLGKKSTWENGSGIEFVILDSGEIHEAFLKTYLKKTPSQFSTYWKSQVFTGKGTNPKSFSSEKDLVDYIAGRDGAVGYVSGAADTSAVKVLKEN